MNTFDGYTTCVNRSAVLSTVHGARVESWNVKIAAEINRERGGKLCSEKKLLLCIYIEKVVVVDRREQEKRASKRRRRSLERVKMFMRRLGCVQRQWWRFHVRSGEEPKPKPVLGCLLRRRFFRFDDSWRLIDFHKSFNDRNSSIAARFFYLAVAGVHMFTRVILEPSDSLTNTRAHFPWIRLFLNLVPFFFSS